VAKGDKLEMPFAVLTPHPGEMSRLLGTSVKRVQEVRERCAEELSMRTSAVTVLKGAGSLIAGDTKRLRCPLGNPYMATPGSGDVLSGIIASLLAQGYSRLESASYGVYIHARAGDEAHKLSSGPIKASDIAKSVPRVIGGLIKE